MILQSILFSRFLGTIILKYYFFLKKNKKTKPTYVFMFSLIYYHVVFDCYEYDNVFISLFHSFFLLLFK
jgi:hypothetical protein